MQESWRSYGYKLSGLRNGNLHKKSKSFLYTKKEGLGEKEGELWGKEIKST